MEKPPAAPVKKAPEAPSETPPAGPPKKPAESPLEKPPAGPVNKPGEASKESALLKPFSQSGWAALAEEPRGVSPSMGRSWAGPVPTRLPKVGLSAPAVGPDEDRGSGLASAGLRRLELAPGSVDAGVLRDQGLTISMAADRRPSLPGPQPGPLRANWAGALNPGLGGDMGRPIPVYPPLERSRPAVYQAPLEPEALPAATQRLPERAPQRPPAQSDNVPPDRGGQASSLPRGSGPGVPRPQSPRLPIALDGYCPVELVEGERWLPGDPRWPVMYQGFTYLFHGPVQRQRFLANPARYVPADSAQDPVLLVDGNRRIPGNTDYCVIYDGQLYMFSSAATLARFKASPERYTVVGRK